jgi:hypothetical protein
VDPFKLGNLRFQTVRDLSSVFVDFVVLIPDYMDAHRNLLSYYPDENRTVEEFLGWPEWRAAWRTAEAQGTGFGAFIADAFGRQMQRLGYLYDGPQYMYAVRGTSKNLLLYHLAYFSRHTRGADFWKRAQMHVNPQLALFGSVDRGPTDKD